mgnify:CR=1 FL=1
MDPISDMLNQIKISSRAGKESVSFAYSKIKHKISEILENEGYLKSVSVSNDKTTGKRLEVKLASRKGTTPFVPKINDIVRVSKPSKRLYRGVKEVFPVNQGLGISIISTNKGLMTDKQAKNQSIGGEILCKIW